MTRADVESFTRLVEAVPGLRARVTLDPEGWPVVPGKYGRLEWRGEAPDGSGVESRRIYAYSNRKRLLFKLREVSGVRPCQSGDVEGAVSMLATDLPAFLSCARLRTQTNGRGRASKGRPPEGMAALRAKAQRSESA